MSGKIKVLFDTNVIIALEDARVVSEDLQKINRVCSNPQRDIRLCIHEGTTADVLRDRNAERRRQTISKLSKYHELAFNRDPSEVVRQTLGVTRTENSVVDNKLLFALHENAVSFLVTEDVEMHKKAQKLGIEERVFTVKEFNIYLRELFGEISISSPEIREESVGNLDINDSIFDSLKSTYPEFESWFKKIGMQQERKAWVSFSAEGEIASICIFKPENEGERTLKLCTFKVRKESNPYAGEYLLFHAMRYAYENRFVSVYLTVYKELDQFSLDETDKRRLQILPSWLESFGFVDKGETEREGEYIYEKQFVPGAEEMYGLDFAIQYWPQFQMDGGAHVVPIKEDLFQTLFPSEILGTPALFAAPSNRTLKKVYISSASTNKINPGDVLFFYCSSRKNEETEGEILAIGVAESVCREENQEKLLSQIGKRSVYTAEQIEENFLKNKRPPLLIKFRFMCEVHAGLTRRKLISDGIIADTPQSIVGLNQEQKGKINSLLEC